jgi:hypothetical protein
MIDLATVSARAIPVKAKTRRWHASAVPRRDIQRAAKTRRRELGVPPE